MFISARMKKMEILTLVSDEPRVTEAVGEMGVLHLTKAPAESGALPLGGPESRETEAHLAALETRAETLCGELGIADREPPEAIPHSTIQQAEAELDRIEAEINDLTATRRRLAKSRGQIEKLLRDTSMLRDIDAPVEQLEDMSFLHFAIGGMTAEQAARAENELGDRAIVLPYKTPFGETKVAAISSKKGRWALESSLEKHGFRRDQLPDDEKGVPSRIAELAEQRLGRLLAETQESNAAARDAAQRHGDPLLAIRRRIQTEHRIVLARENFAHTWATMLITGWTPADNVNALCERILDITEHRAIIEVRDPLAEDEEPPTLMKNHPLFRPFEALVSSYSTPRYNEIEPTPFIAILFLLMFGLMFGDVGHSALLLIVGVVMWLKGKGRVRDTGVIMTLCGVSGLLFGLIYGSVFGIERIGGRELGWIHPLENARRVLLITVLFGVGVITLGILLNIINLFRRREYADGSFDKFGIVGGIFYWGSLAVAARGYALGDVGWLPVLLLVVAPLAVLFARRPVEALIARLRGNRPAAAENLFILLIESGAEAFEAVLAYVANTLSFARIGAFALAHAGLCVAVFELIKIVQTMPGGPVWTVLVFVCGTSLIVLLEGIIVAIQSLRLEYYEFFGKFFRGEGRRYKPFNLRA